MHNKYSFWQLVSEHRIEIPVIQRDYAQGRDTKKSAGIRSSFVERLFAALLGEPAPIHLNFVYGKIKGLKDKKQIKENKEAIRLMLSAVEGYSKSLDLNVCCEVKETVAKDDDLNATCFVPLDGQQRLTTLFLLHCYLLKRLPEEDERRNCLNQLKNFSYLIRPSTKRFCLELVEQPLSFPPNMKLSDLVADSSWFFQYWKKDPSVSGMLNMLDEIHAHGCKLGDEAIKAAVSLLLNSGAKCPISFELLNLDDFKMTDQLYVKMNSRGKQLTPFENFKAWLMEYIEEKGITIRMPDWCDNLDTSWADLFWKHKDDSNMLVDEEFMRFFRNMMQIRFVLDHPLETGKVGPNRATAFRLARDTGPDNEYVYLEHQEYIDMGVLSEESLEEIFECLELFHRYHHEHEKIAEAFYKFVTGDMVLEDRVRFYAIYQFLKWSDATTFDQELPHFLRVYGNLIKNQQIDLDVYKSILSGLTNDGMSGFNDIYGKLVSGQLVLGGFRGSQIKEERLKAALLLRNEAKWAPLVIDAEKQPFFDGQVGFIFALCGLLREKRVDNISLWSAEQEDQYFERVRDVSSIVNELFDDTGFKKDDSHLLERALLACGDTLYRKSSKKMFVSNNKDRDRSWHRVLREYNAEESSDYFRAWNAFEQLIQYMKEGMSEQDVIDAFDDRADWRYAFIKYPETINHCGRHRSFIEWDRQRYLLSGFRRSSPYSELESFHLYKAELENQLHRIDPFTSVEYFTCRQKDGYPGVIIKGCEVGPVYLSIHVRFRGWKKEDAWEIRLVSDNGDMDKLPNAEMGSSGWKLLVENNQSCFVQHHDHDLPHAEMAEKIEQIARDLNILRNKYEQ